MDPRRTLLLLALLAAAPAARADIAVDGVVDAAYGPAKSLQTTQTQANLGDSRLGRLGPADGSELDGAHAVIAGGVLYVTLTGNLLCEGNPVDYGLLFGTLELFVDCVPGGQNTLRGDNWNPRGYGSAPLAGLTFDPGFEPDVWLSCAGTLADFYDPNSAYSLNAWSATLPAGTGGTGFHLGSAAAGGPGTLAGGTNPDGIRVTIDDRNVAGVTEGCDASSGAGATTGVEWAIPLAALGNPACVRLCAMVTNSFHATVTNQVLGPLPPGTCAPGAPAGVDLGAIAGDQSFAVCDPTPARGATWGALKSIYR